MSTSKLSKRILLLNGIMLLLLGGIYLFTPSITLLDGSHTNESLSLHRLVSIALILIGVIALILFKNFKESDEVIRLVSLTFICFHILFGFHWFGYSQIGFSSTIYNLIPHLFLGILGLIVYFK
jgi:hypothetical protein